MGESTTPEYDDDYSTCLETYSTLRVFSQTVPPVRISELLGAEPTDSFEKGEEYSRHKLRRKAHGWFFMTWDIDSRDTRRHVDALLHLLKGKAPALAELRREGCEIDITSYWVSIGQGGPCLEPYQIQELAELGVGIWWDIYFGKDDTGVLERLQRWYASHCNGDWEHAYGIYLDSLDNPGWWLKIDLAGTGLEGRAFEKIERGNGETDRDWISCEVTDGKFDAAGGRFNLAEILKKFLNWAEAKDE